MKKDNLGDKIENCRDSLKGCYLNNNYSDSRRVPTLCLQTSYLNIEISFTEIARLSAIGSAISCILFF